MKGRWDREESSRSHAATIVLYWLACFIDFRFRVRVWARGVKTMHIATKAGAMFLSVGASTIGARLLTDGDLSGLSLPRVALVSVLSVGAYLLLAPWKFDLK